MICSGTAEAVVGGVAGVAVAASAAVVDVAGATSVAVVGVALSAAGSAVEGFLTHLLLIRCHWVVETGEESANAGAEEKEMMLLRL